MPILIICHFEEYKAIQLDDTRRDIWLAGLINTFIDIFECAPPGRLINSAAKSTVIRKRSHFSIWIIICVWPKMMLDMVQLRYPCTTTISTYYIFIQWLLNKDYLWSSVKVPYSATHPSLTITFLWTFCYLNGRRRKISATLFLEMHFFQTKEDYKKNINYMPTNILKNISSFFTKY